MRFGLFEHEGSKNRSATAEIIRIKIRRWIVAYTNNRECLSAILFHRLCEKKFWDFNVTKFVQTKFGFHVFPLADGNFISNVVGRIVIGVKRFH